MLVAQTPCPLSQDTAVRLISVQNWGPLVGFGALLIGIFRMEHNYYVMYTDIRP